MVTEVLLLSPEKSILSFRLASLGSRFGAQMIDVLLIGFLDLFIYLAGISVPFFGILSQPATVATPFLYFILFEGLWNGQTPGKKGAGIRVRMADGTPVTFQAALGRNLLRPADFLPSFYFLGMMAIFTTPRSQRFGDMVANTLVTHEKRGTPNFVPAPHLLAGEHPMEYAVGDLRGMTMEEYRTLRRFCDRYPELPTAIQHRQLEEVWRPIAQRRGVPDVPNVHPLFLAEATVMKYGRLNGLL